MKKTILIVITFCFCLSFTATECLEKLVILGSGPAGLTSALFAAQSHLNPLVIEGEQQDGQIASIYHIENYPGFPEGISGLELAERIHQQAEKFGARFQSGSVIQVDLLQYPFKIILKSGEEVYCESVVIATGASPKWLGLDSEASLIGHGVSASALLDGPQFKGQEVIVVGGGDSAMEQALLLAEEASHVTVIYKEGKLYGASYLQERLLNNPKIKCVLNTEVVEIHGADQGHVTGVLLKNLKTTKTTNLECAGIFVSNGRRPNTDLFQDQWEMTEKGYIVTKENSTHTTVASGCMSAVDAHKFMINKNKKY